MGIVIYYKSRPKFDGVMLDLLGTSTIHSKLFMPYPEWNSVSPGSSDYPNDLCLGTSRRLPGTGRQHTTVTNLISAVDANQSARWALIPRFDCGLVWIAPIQGAYTIWSKNSTWMVPLLQHLTSSSNSYVGNPYVDLADAAQGWNTGAWKSVSFSSLPRWFSKQLLSQTASGRIHPLGQYPVKSQQPDVIAEAAYTGALPNILSNASPQAPTDNLILSRLVERLSPTLFEILCVELLHAGAHHSDLSWMHVAGAGDGGVDGIGFDPSGAPKAFLQAKWEINPKTPIPSGTTHLAYLVGTPPKHKASTWGPSAIANEVHNHWNHLPDIIRRALS